MATNKIDKIRTALENAASANKTYISFNNKKMDNIPSVSLLPVVTCPACKCSEKCYAAKMCNLYPSVMASYAKNTKFYKDKPNTYFASIVDQLNGLTMYRLFRWHVSGDVLNEDYLKGMVDVALKTPQTQFLAFTKRFDIVNTYISKGCVDGSNKIPDNLTIVFSAWDKSFKVDNPHNLPVAYCRFKDATQNPEIPANAIPCKGNCSDCRYCFYLCNGMSVVFDEH